ncbi:hypothetical protein CHS0354_020736 [Potamilus streckersoni]|uniref:Uncharacterized protein n=1 Tax=Potamilus streckersoni TaxID=2493646 RepID=A0AAE0SCK0_9BIVA|nr:hypothetical protein CHS0354_020736 [Potamilus streckersoni]
MEKNNHQNDNKTIDGACSTTWEEAPMDSIVGTYLNYPTSKDIIQWELEVRPHPTRITRVSLKKASIKRVNLEDAMEAKSLNGVNAHGIAIRILKQVKKKQSAKKKEIERRKSIMDWRWSDKKGTKRL